MRRLPLIAVLCLFVSTPALADDGGPDPRFARGSWILSFTLDPLSGLTPGIGYYLADNFSVIAHLGVDKFTQENPGLPDDEVRESEFSAEAIFDFPLDGPVVPYVGAGGGVFDRVDDTAGTTTLDVNGSEFHVLAGLRFLVGTMGSIDVYVQTGSTKIEDNLSNASADGTASAGGFAYSLYFW